MNPGAGYRRSRNAILVLLLMLAGAAWAVVVRQSTGMDTMLLSPAVFLVSWVVMMVAMMFPSAAPMVLTFSKVQASRQAQGRFFVPTWVFVAGYLAVWTAFGALALGVSAGLDAAGIMVSGGFVGGVLLIAAGLYQLSPLKHACLSRCRTPPGFILGSWREGYVGAFRMGIDHGLYCLGCCWLLFVVLFPLGLMNLAAMAAVTLLIFAEKTLPGGPWIGRAAGLGLTGWGLLTLLAGNYMPGM